MPRRLRVLLPLAALGLVAAGHAPEDSSAAFAYKTGAKRADLVVQEIAALAGLKLQTTDDAKLHFLIVSVEADDAERLLATIARVTSSKWLETGDDRTLVPDEDVRRIEKSDRDAKRIEEFKKSQEHFRKQLEKAPEEDEEGFRMFMNSYNSPASRGLAQLALLIDPNEAARLGDSGRLVFSTAPNRMQRSMASAQAARILNTLVVEHNKWADERLKEIEESQKDVVGDAQMAAYMSAMFGSDEKPKKFEGPPTKALLVLEMNGDMFGVGMGSPQVELKVYDQKGAVVVSETLRLGEQWDETVEVGPDGEVMEESTQENLEKIKPEDRVPVEFSEKTRLLAKLQNFEEFTFNVPDPLRNVLADPVTNDPLGFHHTDILLSIAKTKKLNLVANLADSDMFDTFTMGPQEGGVSVGQAFDALTADGGAVVEEKDGWLVVSPADPVSARTHRQNRTVLGQFIAGIVREGSASLDGLATFALSSPSPMQNGTSMLYMLVFSPTVMQGMMGDTMDWNMLRFYGSLPQAQKASLRQGGRVPFGLLTQQGRAILTEMAFSSTANILTTENMKKQDDLLSSLMMFGAMFGDGPKDYTEEPTEVMPGGLPAEGYLTLDIANEPIARPEGGKTIMFFALGALGADELAMFEVINQSASGAMMGEMFSLPKEYRLGNRERLKFNFFLSPQAGIKKTLLDDTVPNDGRLVTLENLPADFKALIEQRKKAIMDSPWGKMIGGIGTLAP